jgi:hypothetical protein
MPRRAGRRSLTPNGGSERSVHSRTFSDRTLEVSPARGDADELPVFSAELIECYFGLLTAQLADLEHAIVPRASSRRAGGGCWLGHDRMLQALFVAIASTARAAPTGRKR